MRSLLYVILILSLLGVVLALDEDNIFIYPTGPGPAQNYVANEVWTLGDVKTIQWTTTYSSYYITLMQEITSTEAVVYSQNIYSTWNPMSASTSWLKSVQVLQLVVMVVALNRFSG